MSRCPAAPRSRSTSPIKHVLGRDIETRSTTSLKKVGAHKYAADPALERVNRKGFHVDCTFAQAARRIAQEAEPAITRLRVKRGLPEFDDGLPGEPDTPFRMIRSIILTPFPSHSEGAHRGEARPDHHPTQS